MMKFINVNINKFPPIKPIDPNKPIPRSLDHQIGHDTKNVIF